MVENFFSIIITGNLYTVLSTFQIVTKIFQFNFWSYFSASDVLICTIKFKLHCIQFKSSTY